jgi:GT2 family glycosyltransferase
MRIDSDRGGALLESGVNVLVFDGEQPSEVDWLSGCSMSYRTSALDGLRFDERRGGNGLGEDVDFSARLGSRGRLLWVPDARVEHRQSAINRESALRVKRKAVAHRWQLAQDRVAPVRRRWVLVAAVGESALHIVKALSRASRHEAYAAAAVVLGMFDLCRWDRKRHVTDASRTASPPLGRISGNWWEPAGEDELAPAPQLGMSVIVCTYRRPARLHACLTALRTEVTATDEIVVVVPAEDGESRKVVAAAVPDAIVAHVEPGRVATACAAGVLAASRPLVAFLDDDAIPMPGWVAALRAPFADLSVGAVGGPIRNFAGVRTSSSFFTQREVAWVDRLGRPHSRLHELPARRLRCPADFLAGSNMAVRRDLLDVAEFVLPGMAPGWEMLVAAQVSDRSRTIVYDSSIVVEHHPAPRDHLPRSDEVRDAFDVAFAMRYLAGRTGRALPRAFWTAVGSRRAPGLLLPVLVHDRSARSRWAPARRGRAAARRALGARRP